MLVRPAVQRQSAALLDAVMPGDLMAGGESALAGAISTVGNGTWTAAAIATGIIYRSGPVGGYTDTTDSAANIIAALAGSNATADVVPGTTFRLIVQNSVAQALTFAAGAGVVTGNGTLNIAASLVREYLLTVVNASPQVTLASNTTNGSAAVTFVIPSGMNALNIGVAPTAVNITPGMSVSGTGVPANTTVLGVTQGQGGLIGVTLSANATATSATGGTPLVFTPTVKIDSLRSSTL